jgi:hypothetical protein
MNARNINWLREFMAAEMGIPAENIEDREVLARHWKRWSIYAAGLLLVVFVYLALRTLVNHGFARGFVATVVLVGLALQLRRFFFSGRLTAGPLFVIKKQAAEKLGVKPDQISDAAVQDFDRLNARDLLRRLAIAAPACFLVDWLWPSIAVEVLVLAAFYTIAALAWTGTRPVGRPSS